MSLHIVCTVVYLQDDALFAVILNHTRTGSGINAVPSATNVAMNVSVVFMNYEFIILWLS